MKRLLLLLLTVLLLSACTILTPRPDPGEQRAQDSVNLLVQDLGEYVRSGEIRTLYSDSFVGPATIDSVREFIKDPPYQYYVYPDSSSYRILSEKTTETGGEFLIASYATAQETTIMNTRWEGRVCASLDVEIGSEPGVTSASVDCPPKTPEEKPSP